MKLGADRKVGLTFDDVLLIPKFSDVASRRDVDTKSRFTLGIPITIPLVSANMDTVTESAMAIAAAREGGIGVIHRFLTIEEQVSEVARVKRSEGVVIEDPITLGPEATVREALDLLAVHHIGGIVVVDSGKKVLGLVTTRDLSLEEDLGLKLRGVMTPLKDLVTARKGVSIDKAKQVLKANKVEKLPLLDGRGRLAGLITSKDILKRRQYPYATKDSKGRLSVAAAVGVRGDYMERARRLLDAGADALVVDIAHGHSKHAVDTVKRLKKEFGKVEIVAGNVATASGTTDLIRAGADAVKVGVGSGSICVTRVVNGFGVPQLTAILESSQAAEREGVP
ncbi:MAG: IMP dehydrogenase, partial [Nitrososphaerota archaeon]|nr:IMP dehydrogenase [Nitrososphaerota archaeon]